MSPGAAPPAAGAAIFLSATGDIIMGSVPGRLPAAGGKGFFDSVRPALRADLVMGNLEQPLTEDTGAGKCDRAKPASATPGAARGGAATPSTVAAPTRRTAPKATNCHQFRAPPGYAAHLRDAGFEVLNQANNHGHDYGAAGYRNTQQALAGHGLAHTGAKGQITVVEAAGVRVAVLGFSSYAWNNSLVDIGEAQRLVRRAVGQADLVVVQAHMGGEGADKAHVKQGTEMFLGENRGDPVKFSHAVIDAGADLVVGHGPHVLRGMEFYRGRLIAYSLGNFAGGGRTLSSRGPLGLGGVLKVSLTRTGDWAGGEFLSTHLDGAGRPTRDDRERGRALVAELSADDFGATGARLSADGSISPPS